MTHRVPPATIIRMAELRLSGMSRPAIARWLRREGLHMARSDRSAEGTVRRCLRKVLPRG